MRLRYVSLLSLMVTLSLWFLLLAPSFHRQLLIPEDKTYPYASGMPLRAFLVEENTCCSLARIVRVQPGYFILDVSILLLPLVVLIWLVEQDSYDPSPALVVIAVCLFLTTIGLAVLGMSESDRYELHWGSPYDLAGLCSQAGQCY